MSKYEIEIQIANLEEQLKMKREELRRAEQEERSSIHLNRLHDFLNRFWPRGFGSITSKTKMKP